MEISKLFNRVIVDIPERFVGYTNGIRISIVVDSENNELWYYDSYKGNIELTNGSIHAENISIAIKKILNTLYGQN